MALDKQTIDMARLDDLVGKAVSELGAGYGGVMIAIGNRLGLYRAMAGVGPMTSHEVAQVAGCAERYVREWLNGQAAGGYVAYHPASQTYELTPEQAAILADDTSPVFMPAIWDVVAAAWADAAQTAQAIRTGKGVAWGDHDGRLHCGVAAFFRNGYRASLVPEWLPSLEGVVPRLQAGARVADIGCGHGHSTLLMAEAFPNSRFLGIDTHPASITAARANAQQAGLSDRVEFLLADARAPLPGVFDLICFFDCLHDLGFPVEAARRAREALAPDGTLMLVEPAASDRVEENLNPIGRIYYTGSTWLCCAHAISEEGTHVLGAQAGEARLAQVCREAGFSRIRKATQTPFNLILEARP
ncbi:class I SAM-dependent methyltransferase [Paracoccus actinidiae]|jgi:SAM-dependent methyltransferase|uniref:class I SAM-dependent methyltransferase n=1 Tax=Paracoccus actinidiae TaxID=3064531 RepID=UPI0027D33C67|nr:class I SAM-dependent methyltransferase [Paracoccus sp. M09]